MPGPDPALERRWRVAQDQLFGMLVTSPELYRQAVQLVGAAMTWLRASAPTPAGVADAAPRIDAVVADLAHEQEMELGSLLALVGPAALATRLDELRHGSPAGGPASS